MNNNQKSIDIKLKVDNSDVEKSFKEVEKSSIKMADNVSKNSKKANDSMVKDTQKATSKLNKQFKDLQKQMNKALDATQLSSKLSNSLNKIKTQLNSALGNIQLDVQLNASNTGSSGGVASALAGVGAGIASSGAVGASLQKSLSQAHKASQGLVENTKRTQKHLKDAVSQNKDFNKEMKSILKNADEIDDVSFQQMISGVHELDKLSKTMKGFRKNLDFTEIMNANNMKLGEADKLVNDLIVLFTHLNGVMNTENGVGAYINQIERLEQVQSALNKQKRGLNYGDRLISPESLQTIKQATVVANTATKPMARFRVVLEEIGQSKAMTKIGHGWTKLATSFKTHAPKITGAIDKIKTKTSQWLSNHTKTAKGIEKANKGVGNSFKSLLKSIMPFVSAFAIFNTLKKSIHEAMQAVETDHMFNTVMGNSRDEMSEWVQEVNKTMGLGIVNTKQYSSIITQMGRAMGLSGEQAMDMSKKMTKMAGDISSFYDADLVDVQRDLRSALSGSFETMDKYGIVLRQSIVDQYAWSHGIAETGKQLNNAQRAMATTALIESQLGLANGDLEKSLHLPANQARVLQYNLQDLSVALGKCFIPIVQVVLPILNSFVKALTVTINAIANFISQVFALFGVNVDFEGIGGVVDDMATGIENADVGSGGLADNLASGADSAKKINKFLTGIDELNIVTSKQDSGGSSGGSSGSGSTGGVGTGGIDNGLAQVETKFSKWAEKVASALQSVWGSLKDGWNSVDGYISSSLDKLKQSFSNLGQSIESFLIGCWNNGGEELIYNIGRLAGAFTGLAIDVSGQVINAVAKLFDHLNPENNANTRKFINAMNECLVACQNFALSAGGWLQTFMDNGGQEFLNNIGDIATIVGTILVKAFDDGITSITDFMNSFVGQALIKGFATLLEEVTILLEGMLGWVRDNQEWLETLGVAVLGAYGAFKLINGAIKLYNSVMTICSTLTIILSNAIAFLASPMGIAIVVIGALIAAGIWLWKNWDMVCEKAKELKDWISKKWTEAKDAVVNKVREMVEGVKKWWNDLKTNTVNKFNEIKTSIINKWNEIKTSVVNKVIEIKNNIVNKWTEIKTNVINKVVDIKDGIKNKFTEAYNNVTTIFTNIKTSISDKITEAKDAVWRAIEKIKGFFNFKWSLPKIKLPHFKINGEFSLMPPKVPSFKVDWYSNGGIFTQKTILGGIGVGDANKGVGNNAEAVLPLNVLWKELNDNFDKQNRAIAKMITSSNQPIILSLNIDGDTLAKKQFKSFKELAQLGIVDFSELV